MRVRSIKEVALLVALAAGWVTGAIGPSLTMGAFLGGMIIAETPYRVIIQSEIRPFRRLLLGFVLISVDMSLNVRTLPPVRALVGVHTSAVLIAAVALSLALTPTLAEVGRLLAGRIRRRAMRPADPELQPQEIAGPVFTAGMGRVGRTVADVLIGSTSATPPSNVTTNGCARQWRTATRSRSATSAIRASGSR